MKDSKIRPADELEKKARLANERVYADLLGSWTVDQ